MQKTSLILTLLIILVPYNAKASCDSLADCYQTAAEKLARTLSRLKAQHTENNQLFKAQQAKKRDLMAKNQRLIAEKLAELQETRSIVLSQQLENQHQVAENQRLAKENRRLKNDIKALTFANLARLSEIIPSVTSLESKITAISRQWKSCLNIGGYHIPLQDNTGDFIHYFLNRDKVLGRQGHQMGELFFAISQSDKHVQLGKYNNNCWTKIIEVDKKYLIEGLRPLTVGQAAEKFPPLTKEAGVKPGSTLWLRAQQKPEYYKNKPPHRARSQSSGRKRGWLGGVSLSLAAYLCHRLGRWAIVVFGW